MTSLYFADKVLPGQAGVLSEMINNYELLYSDQ